MRKYKKAFSCMLDGECPETNTEAGCPAWWEWLAENGTTVRGCGFSQEIKMPLTIAMLHGADCAAASADKAASVAAASQNAAMGGMSLMLGLASGQIKPPSQLPISGEQPQMITRRMEESGNG